MKVDVYFNLHKKTLSVRHKGIVIAHSDYVKIQNPKFVVSEAGRRRVLREKRKNVHAFVRGELLSTVQNFNEVLDNHSMVTYNPYKYATFVDKSSEAPVLGANEAVIFGRKILAKLA